MISALHARGCILPFYVFFFPTHPGHKQPNKPIRTSPFFNLHGKILGKLLRRLLELLWIGLQLLRDLLLQRMIRIRRLQHGKHYHQTMPSRQCRTPLSHSRRTHFPGRRVDGWMVYLGMEFDDGRFEWVLRWKVELKDKVSAFVRTVRRAYNVALPLEQVVAHQRYDRTKVKRFRVHFGPFLHQSSRGHRAVCMYVLMLLCIVVL
mmetsp:Transcript_15104/g.42604  ORF Transcript_15104/g.42604 Transcript_15104/m.42604 type:complete len:205 (+) Transcript_15104:204-818(+)